MKKINHLRNAVRFVIVVLWIAAIGLLYTAFKNSGNVHSLAWGTWLLYISVGICIAYLGVVKTIKLWNIE